jgi:hypothetical protein
MSNMQALNQIQKPAKTTNQKTKESLKKLIEIRY